ncbi:hypothetical protein EON65_28130 [archaeon]|nr:MAG: hypothetical protein EON65_28130 [archaeon]
METQKCPYKLHVTVKGATNLPVADITTSDPYVVVSMGDKKIGQTKTIYKNHLRPVWEEHFMYFLLHTKNTLQFKIFDEDKGKDDDLLGVVEIKLGDLPLNEIVENCFPVTNLGGYKANATLELSIILGRNDRSISIISTRNRQSEKRIAVEGMILEPVNYIRNDFEWSHVPDCVHTTFLDLAAEGHTGYFCRDLVRDLLYDVSYLTKSDGQPMDAYGDLSGDFIVRKQAKLQNASKLFLKTKEFHRHSPIEQKSIQINLSSDERKFVVITLPNRFSMWTWSKWLQLAYDVWTGEVKKSNLPKWALSANPSLSISSLANVFSSTEKTSAGRTILNLDRPFELLCNGETFNLRSMSSIVMALDSLAPKPYVLEIDVGAFNLTGALIEEPEDLRKPQRKASGIMGVAGNVFGAVGGAVTGTVTGVVKGVGTVAGAATNVAVNTTVGVATTAVGAVRTVASGDPMHIIREGQGKFTDVGQSLITTIVSAPQSVFGKVETLAVLRCGYQAQTVNAGDQTTRSMTFDLTMSDVDAVSQPLTSDGSDANPRGHNKKTASSDSKEFALVPGKIPSLLSLDVFLVHGVTGMEKVVGQTSVKVNQLLGTKFMHQEGRSAEFKLDEWNSVELPLDQKIGKQYSITVYTLIIHGCLLLFFVYYRRIGSI